MEVETGLTANARRVALLAGDLNDATAPLAHLALQSSDWNAVYTMLQDGSAAGLATQAVRLAKDCSDPEAALAHRGDITHVFFLANTGSSRKQTAAALDTFQDLVTAAEAAGCHLHETHFINSRQPSDQQSSQKDWQLRAVSSRGSLLSSPAKPAALTVGAPTPGQQRHMHFPAALAEAWTRGRWLLGLLILQSASSAVLDAYQDLLKRHLVVTFFLTMLVGAGGNAGNQSAIKVIRGLATGKYRTTDRSLRSVLLNQAIIALLLGGALAVGGLARVYVTHGVLRDAAAIAASLLLIVLSSVLLGSALPFALARAGIDPAHAGSSIQVIMDVLGVGITCMVCTLILDPVLHPSLRHPVEHALLGAPAAANHT